MVSILASGPSCPVFNFQHFWNFFIVSIAGVNQQRCLEESRQCLENVDWTHLVLASGKLAKQKSMYLSNVDIKKIQFLIERQESWKATQYPPPLLIVSIRSSFEMQSKGGIFLGGSSSRSRSRCSYCLISVRKEGFDHSRSINLDWICKLELM